MRFVMAIETGGSSSARRDTGSPVNSAARNTALTIGLVLVSRVLGVLRDILLGHLFGQNAETSLYRAAFGVPDLIALVIAGGGLSSVFIPVFAQYWNDKQEEDAWKVFGAIMSIVMVAIAVLVVLMEIGVVPLTHLLNHKFTPPEVAETAGLSAILLPAQWFLIVGGFMMGTLYARKRFLIPALGPVVYNLGTIAGALSQVGSAHPQMPAMAWGTLIGAAAGSFVLPLFELIRIGVKCKS
jgi:putative peptidoglycan lipid II flippase